jgi:hypothetical protein
MSTSKRLALLLLTFALLGTAACTDASGPQADACTENQGSGGRLCEQSG